MAYSVIQISSPCHFNRVHTCSRFTMRLLSALGFLALPLCWTGVAADSSSQPAAAPDLNKLQYIPDSHKPRVFVLTDILNEPDDQQSVVRYLLYSNEFDTRAICATTSTWLRDKPRPEAIQKIVQAYGEVVDNLNKHVHPQNQYPSVEKVLSLITSGPAVSRHSLSLRHSRIENQLHSRLK